VQGRIGRDRRFIAELHQPIGVQQSVRVHLRKLGPNRGYGLRGPVNFDLNMSLKKTIPIHKSVNALIDVSAYNVTNSIIFGAPPVNTGTPSTFGTVTSQANNSRDIQLAFRLNFQQEFYRRNVSLWPASVAFTDAGDLSGDTRMTVWNAGTMHLVCWSR
jgi:hypothetical protein